MARRVYSHQCWPPVVAHKITTLLHNQIKKKKKKKRKFSAFIATSKMHCIYNYTITTETNRSRESKPRIDHRQALLDVGYVSMMIAAAAAVAMTTSMRCFQVALMPPPVNNNDNDNNTCFCQPTHVYYITTRGVHSV